MVSRTPGEWRTLIGGLLACQTNVLAATIMVAQSPPHRAPSVLRVSAGPNVQVSLDGEVPHLEPAIAASPDDPRTLVAGALVWATEVPGAPFRGRVYVTHDGGGTWTANPLREEDVVGTDGDIAVATGRDGALYFFSGQRDTFPNGRYANTRMAYRSHDNGGTWSRPTVIGNMDDQWDRQYAAVDLTRGPHAGRVYMAGELFGGGPHGSGVAVAYSDDSGATFVDGGVACGNGNMPLGAGPRTSPIPLVLSDGTLLVPCSAWELSGDGQIPFGLGVSTDGGRMFGPYRRVSHVQWHGARLAREVASGNFLAGEPFSPSYAVDQTDGRFRDRVYATWFASRATHTVRNG